MRKIKLISEPIREQKIAIASALPPCPSLAIGYPSKHVAIEEGVPGIFNKIEQINPPLIPPTYKPISSEIPSTGWNPNDKGKKSAIPIAAVRPGVAPNIIPITTPKKSKVMVIGVNTAIIPGTTTSKPIINSYIVQLGCTTKSNMKLRFMISPPIC